MNYFMSTKIWLEIEGIEVSFTLNYGKFNKAPFQSESKWFYEHLNLIHNGYI